MKAVEPISVDRSGYNAAFDQYRACVEAAGARLEELEVDSSTGQFTWSVVVKDDEAAAVESCYEPFRETDESYALKQVGTAVSTDADQIDHFSRYIAPCLAMNGEDFAIPETTSSPEWARLNDLFMKLASAGKCPGITAQE